MTHARQTTTQTQLAVTKLIILEAVKSNVIPYQNIFQAKLLRSNVVILIPTGTLKGRVLGMERN